MADKPTNIADLKPGSSKADAAAVSGQSDFGVHERDVVGRTYTSNNTKAADHGAAQANSFESIGVRDSGAGGRDSGTGSSSGGDIDTDFVGLDGAGLATNITKGDRHTAADATGTSDDAASGGHANNQPGDLVGKVGGPHPQVNVVTASDARTANDGADAASNTSDTDIDDSFRGEISSAEASGRDTLGK